MFIHKRVIILDKSKARRDNKNHHTKYSKSFSRKIKILYNLEQVQVVNSKGNSKKDNSLPKII